jgi:hypothetical protein
MSRSTQENHERVMRNATRCADLIRIGGAGILAKELLESGYTDTWYAYQHCSTVIRSLVSKGNFRRAGVWDERRDLYLKARRAIWQEMLRRGMRQEVPIPTLQLPKDFRG